MQAQSPVPGTVSPVLSLRGISKSFPGVRALNGVELDLYPGLVTALIGENGAGKSTIVKILTGIYQPDEGTITVDGQPAHFPTAQAAGQAGVTAIHQETVLFDDLTVAENILATREPRRFGFINAKELAAKPRAIVADLGLPIDVSEKVGNLSIAQRQLVEIAKGLSHEAKVVILDEPTSSLSDSEAEILFEIIGRLKSRGVAVIYISHRMEEIMRLSDDITVIRDGEYVSTHDRDDVTIEALIALMVGRRMDEIYPPPAHEQKAKATPVLAVDGLTRDGEDVVVADYPAH